MNNQNKSLIKLRELKGYTSYQLLTRFLEQVEQEDITALGILADMFILVGKITGDCPDLFQAILQEMKKRKAY
jgi:hypothetical protein